MNSIRTGFALASLLAVTACGGGSGSISPETIRTLTGSDAPLERASDQAARVAGIVSRADSLIVSTIIAETNRAELRNLELRTSCSRQRCLWSEAATGLSGTIDLRDLEFASVTAREVLAKNGITMIEGTAEGIESYGAWMHHGAFGVQTERWAEEGISIVGRYGLAVGELTGHGPRTSATWRGVMTGTPRDGTFRGDVLQGDATLTYDYRDRRSSPPGYIDAAFTDIVNIDRGTRYSVPVVRFENVPASRHGTFAAGLSGNYIQGGFYGPDHAEAAGIFEQAGIVGAFGAKRR